MLSIVWLCVAFNQFAGPDCRFLFIKLLIGLLITGTVFPKTIRSSAGQVLVGIVVFRAAHCVYAGLACILVSYVQVVVTPFVSRYVSFWVSVFLHVFFEH